MVKVMSILCVSIVLSGCNAHTQRLLGYGPYQYCRDGDVCFQAGETWKFYPFSEGDAQRFLEEGKRCWDESNRANWDSCTARF